MAGTRSLTVRVLGDVQDYVKKLQQAEAATAKNAKSLKLAGDAHAAFGRSVAFAATSLVGGAGIVSALHASIDAAVKSQEVQRRSQQQLEALGISYQQHAKHIDEVIQKQSQLSALDDEDLQTSFTNLVRVTKDVNRALELNGVAADVARGKNVSLEQATAIVTKASLGQLGALKRMGVEIPPVTTAVDALKDSKNKYTQAELAAAKAADATATRQQAVQQLQKQFAGQAEAYGKTAAGAQERLKVATENLQESIGQALLPTVEKVANGVSGWLGRTENLEKVQRTVNGVVQTATKVVGALWPHLEKAGQAANSVAQAVGGWDKAFMIVTGGVLVGKISSLASSIGGTNGLASALFRATLGITGKGGLLAALRSLPAIITIPIVLSQVIPKDIKVQGKEILSREGLGRAVANIPVAGDLAAASAYAGQKLGEAAGLSYKDAAGYDTRSPEHKAYVAGLGGGEPPAGMLSSGSVTAAYYRGRRESGTAPRAAQASGSQSIAGMTAVDYSASKIGSGLASVRTGGGGRGGGGGGGVSQDRTGRSFFSVIAGMRPDDELFNTARADRAVFAATRLFPQSEVGPLSGFNADTIAADRARSEQQKQAAAAAIAQRIEAMRAAVDAKRQVFAQAFSRLGDAAAQAISAKYAKLQQDLSDTLSRQLKEIEDARAQLTPAEAELQALQDAKADQDRQDALAAAQASGDAKQIADAEYAIRVAALQKRATAERKAADDKARADTDAANEAYRTNQTALATQEKQETDSYANRLKFLEEYLGDRKTTVEQANGEITTLLGEFAGGLDRDISNVLAKLNELRSAAGMPTTAAAALAVAFPNFHAMASGGDFMVNRPTLFLAGEAGPERATFTRAGGRNYHGGGNTVVVQVGGNVVSERDITYAVRRGIVQLSTSSASTNVVTRTRTGV